MTATVQRSLAKLAFALIGAACFAGLVGGWLTNQWLIASGAAVISLCFFALNHSPFSTLDDDLAECDNGNKTNQGGNRVTQQSDTRKQPVSNGDELLTEMSRQGRFALLLRPEIVESLSEVQRKSALTELDKTMALIATGQVRLRTRGINESDASPDRDVAVKTFYIDRYSVTNRQYYDFVMAGGYEQQSLWNRDAVSALPEFVDRSGRPGPSYWINGKYAPGQEDHPVVGINWFEAAAYACWIGKRLPSDAEWVKAATCPIQTTDGELAQHNYPWGDSMNREFANLWGSDPERIVAVTEFSAGVNKRGVHQMIGNVWEWMHSDLGVWDDSRDRLDVDVPMKSIRGGAFDTYFDSQATCQFQSGEYCFARRHNIGFRCVVAAGDLSLTPNSIEPNRPDDANQFELSDEQMFEVRA